VRDLAVVGWDAAALAQQIALPNRHLQYSQVFVCDLFACEAPSHPTKRMAQRKVLSAHGALGCDHPSPTHQFGHLPRPAGPAGASTSAGIRRSRCRHAARAAVDGIRAAGTAHGIRTGDTVDCRIPGPIAGAAAGIRAGTHAERCAPRPVAFITGSPATATRVGVG